MQYIAPKSVLDVVKIRFNGSGFDWKELNLCSVGQGPFSFSPFMLSFSRLFFDLERSG